VRVIAQVLSFTARREVDSSNGIHVDDRGLSCVSFSRARRFGCIRFRRSRRVTRRQLLTHSSRSRCVRGPPTAVFVRRSASVLVNHALLSTQTKMRDRDWTQVYRIYCPPMTQSKSHEFRRNILQFEGTEQAQLQTTAPTQVWRYSTG